MKTSKDRVESLVYLAEETLAYVKAFGPDALGFPEYVNCFIDLVREIQIEQSLEDN